MTRTPLKPFEHHQVPSNATKSEWLYGLNVAQEVLRAGRRRVYEILWARHDQPPLAWQSRPLKIVKTTQLDQLLPHVVHQGIAIKASLYPLQKNHHLELARQQNGLLLALDGIQDPHNMGAILRSALAFGVRGVLLDAHRSSPITAAVVKVSAGASEHLNIDDVGNLANTLGHLKKHGWWLIGSALDGIDIAKTSLDFDKRVLVIGGEHRGISRLVQKNCDLLVRIPQSEKINSLNAAVAAGILLYSLRETVVIH